MPSNIEDSGGLEASYQAQVAPSIQTALHPYTLVYLLPTAVWRRCYGRDSGRMVMHTTRQRRSRDLGLFHDGLHRRVSGISGTMVYINVAIGTGGGAGRDVVMAEKE